MDIMSLLASTVSNVPLGLGCNGENVKAIQEVMKQTGTYEGTPDGNYDKETKNSVKATQKTLGVPLTGIWDEVTQQALSQFIGTQGLGSFKADVGNLFPTVGGGFGGFGNSIGGLTGLGDNKLNIPENSMSLVSAAISKQVPILGTLVPGGAPSASAGSGHVGQKIPHEYVTCTITNLNNNTVIEFPTAPQELTENMVANFEQTAVKGRSTPYYSYSSGGPRTISFNLKVMHDYTKEGLPKLVRKLQSLTLPHLETCLLPPKAHFVLGNLFSEYVVVQSVDVTYSGPFGDGIFRTADLNVMLHVYEDRGTYDDEFEKLG